VLSDNEAFILLQTRTTLRKKYFTDILIFPTLLFLRPYPNTALHFLTTKTLNMKKIFLLLLLAPLLAAGQNKIVLSSFRITPKPDKVVEFEKALAAHAQKYHTGDWKWRVFKVQSGPESAAYHISEGPNSWEGMDSRGDISAEHKLDWDKNVTPLTTGDGSSSYSQFNADMSTVQLTDYADKIVISHMYPKPGMVNKMTELVKKLKKVWEASNESMAVYNIINSGDPQISIVSRLKGGLKELDPSFRKPLAERYNAVYGEGAFDYWLADYANCVEKRWNEMLFFRANLSSK
jgi:hypothetical protein